MFANNSVVAILQRREELLVVLFCSFLSYALHLFIIQKVRFALIYFIEMIIKSVLHTHSILC